MKPQTQKELQQRNRLGTMSRKTTGVLKQVLHIETSPLILIHRLITNTCSVRKIGMICMLHLLLLTAVSIIQTVVVTAREDVLYNYQHMLIARKGIYAVWSRPHPFACKPITCFREYGQM